MFSSQELSTAVQQGCNITHFIWNDEAYNMVEFQEEMVRSFDRQPLRSDPNIR